MALPRFLVNAAGRIKEVLTITTSAGAADAEKVPSTNSDGVLDPSLLNAATTGNDVLVMTKPDGTIDPSIMPPGIGADTSSVMSSEVLNGPALVNIWDDAGTPKVRNADATTEGKEVHGFVLETFASGVAATVYHEGKVTGLSGMVPGARQYLSTTPGARTETAPNGSGNVVQFLGTAINATTLDFEKSDPITRA